MSTQQTFGTRLTVMLAHMNSAQPEVGHTIAELRASGALPTHWVGGVTGAMHDSLEQEGLLECGEGMRWRLTEHGREIMATREQVVADYRELDRLRLVN